MQKDEASLEERREEVLSRYALNEVEKVEVEVFQRNGLRRRNMPQIEQAEVSSLQVSAFSNE